MASLNRNDFNFIANTSDWQRDVDEQDKFLDILNRNFIDIFPNDDGIQLTVTWADQKNIIKNGGSSYISKLKSYKNFYDTNTNKKYEMHRSVVTNYVMKTKAPSFSGYINALTKVLKFAINNPNKKSNKAGWNIVYYSGVEKGNLHV